MFEPLQCNIQTKYNFLKNNQISIYEIYIDHALINLDKQTQDLYRSTLFIYVHREKYISLSSENKLLTQNSFISSHIHCE